MGTFYFSTPLQRAFFEWEIFIFRQLALQSDFFNVNVFIFRQLALQTDFLMGTFLFFDRSPRGIF
jgi:hypothetical protein